MVMKNIFTLFLSLCFLNIYSQKHDTEWTCIDENGKEIFKIKANWVSNFENGLARVYQQNWNGKEWIQGYGFIDKTGKVVVPCIYNDAQHFKDSLVTWVKTNDKKWLLINRKGEIIPTKDYSKVSYFFEDNHGLSGVYEGDNLGFINREGKEVIPCKYFGSTSFGSNRACVGIAGSKDEMYGFMNRAGEMVIPVQFSQAGISQFNGNTCRVQKKGSKTFLIDSMGNTVFKTKYGSLQDMYFGLAPVSLGSAYDKWSFVNEKDEIAIKGPFDFTHPFNEEGITDIEVKEKTGLIDTIGKEILPVKYLNVYYDYKKDGFYCGVYGTRDNPESLLKAKKDYFLKDFKKFEMDDLAYLGSANYSDRILFQLTNGKRGYMDRTGKVIIEAKYEKADFFQEDVAWVR